MRPGTSTHWLRVLGVWAWGPVNNPQRALLRPGFARCLGQHGGARGGRLLPWCGASGVGRSPTPDGSPFGACCRGPLPGGCGCGGMRAWGPVTNPTARACELALRAVGAAGGSPGGPLLPGPGASGVGRSPTSDSSSFRACSEGPLPTGCGCGGCGLGDPSPTQQRALLRAGFSCCGGGTREPQGGRLLPGCGASRVGRSPSLDRWSFGACCWGPLPTGCGCAGCWDGDLSPTPPRALLRAGYARCGGGTRAPRGGTSCLSVGRPGPGALAPRPLVFWGVQLGPTTHWLWVRGVLAREPATDPTARALVSWLCALWRRHERAQGGRLLPGCGASGVRRSPIPDCSSFGACGRGPLPTGCGCGVRAWGPGCPWHLLPCRGSSCVVRASRVCGTRWPLWLGTCPRAVVVAGGVPLWRASWPCVGAPRLVRSGRFWCCDWLSRRRVAFPHPRGCRPRLYWVVARGTWRPAENRAHCASRWPLPRQGRWARSASYPLGAPRWGCPWRVPPASVLGCVRCGGSACVEPVTDASGFPHRPSFDRGLRRCTGAV